MKRFVRARTAACVAALSLGGLVAGCSDQEHSADALDIRVAASLSTSDEQVGSAAAKGAELTAVAIARRWISARNEALRTGDRSAVDALTGPDCGTCERFLRGDRWSVGAARVSQHTVDAATVIARVTSKGAQHLALKLEVARVAGEPVVTEIVVVP